MNGRRFSGQSRDAAAPSSEEIAAAVRERHLAKRWLSELARGHPSVKTWRARLAAAEKALVRALP